MAISREDQPMTTLVHFHSFAPHNHPYLAIGSLLMNNENELSHGKNIDVGVSQG